MSSNRYAKANNKYVRKKYDKNIESSYLAYLDAKKLYGYPMCEKPPVGGFKWVEDLSEFNESFIKNYDKNSDRGYFFEVDVKYPKKLFNLHRDLPFLPEREKIKKCEKLVCTVQNKRNLCCSHKCTKTSAKSRINTKKST